MPYFKPNFTETESEEYLENNGTHVSILTILALLFRMTEIHFL